jgi:hypothetical protein
VIRISLPRRPSLNGVIRKIHVNRCSGGRWYARLVGQTVVAEVHDSYGWWVREGGAYNPINYILDADCTVLPLEN